MCGCTEASHQETRDAIRQQHITTIDGVYRALAWRTPNGCASCRPAVNYYLISTWPKEAKDDPQSRFINERSHANIQKDGTYSVIPRMWGGETTAAELRRIADVVDKYQIPLILWAPIITKRDLQLSGLTLPDAAGEEQSRDPLGGHRQRYR